MEKRGPPLAAAETLAWRMWGARTSGEELVAQAQAVKVVTASTTAASDLAADGGHARKRRVSSVRAKAKGDGGPEEEKMPGCRSSGAAGEEVEDGLLGCLRLAGQAEGRGGHPQ